eukprot:5908794-Amphidinium_carterae.1
MPDNFTDSSFELAGKECETTAERAHVQHETVRLAKRLRGLQSRALVLPNTRKREFPRKSPPPNPSRPSPDVCLMQLTRPTRKQHWSPRVLTRAHVLNCPTRRGVGTASSKTTPEESLPVVCGC